MRLPGRVDEDDTTFTSSTELATALRRAAATHGEHEKRTGQHDAGWPDGIGAVFGNTRAALGLVVGLGLCGTGLSYIFYYLIVDRLGAVAASGVTYIPPVVALVIGTVLAGEPVRGLDVLAMAAILLGVGILQSARRSLGQD